MKGYLSHLNAAERRVVIGFSVAVFIVLNWIFVKPHFSDWSDLKGRIEKAQNKLAMYDRAIQRVPELTKAIAILEKGGSVVPPEDQAIAFLRTIQNEAARTGVRFLSSSRMSSGNNSVFFLEQIQTVSLESTEKQLVEFLYNLGAADNSVIRVRGLFVRPEPNRQQLNANVTLVARYQKKLPGPSAPATPPPAAATATTPKAAITPKAAAQTNRVPALPAKPDNKKKS